MIGPFIERGLDGAIFGFAVETGLHLLRIIVSGVFDRFPKLRIVVGHLGEGLPYWLFRIDFMHRAMVKANRYASVQKLQKKPSDYIKENIYVTTSGMAWEPPILYAQSVLGVDRVLYAMDYPYQFVPEEVKVTDDLPISDADKKKLYQTNAEQVFGLAYTAGEYIINAGLNANLFPSRFSRHCFLRPPCSRITPLAPNTTTPNQSPSLALSPRWTGRILTFIFTWT